MVASVSGKTLPGVPTHAGPDGLGAAFVRRWIEEAAARIEAERDHLTQLDAAIGDADHGINMDRGLKAALAQIAGDGSAPAGALLVTAGRVLIFTVGGAAGPLYGTAFRRAGEALGGSDTFGAEDLLGSLRAGLEGIQQLGAAMPGDKTIVDAYAPALAAFEREIRAGGSLAHAAAAARNAAEEGMRATIPLQARKGRAPYLGSRSMGHQDPGATSTFLLFAALADAVGEA
jgi:dihydroxyacetone kinase-like protein